MISKVQNYSPTFGKIHIDRDSQTLNLLSEFSKDEKAKNALLEALDVIDKESGEHRVSFWMRRYSTGDAICLSSKHFQKGLPRITIPKDATLEQKLECIKQFQKKAHLRINPDTEPDIGDILDRYS